MTIGAWLAIVGTVLGIAGVLGIAYAVLRSNVSLKTTELWKQQAEAMEERYNTEKEIRHSCEEELDGVYERLDKLEEAQKVLVNVLAKNIDAEALKVLHEVGLEKATRTTRRRRRDRDASTSEG